MIELEAEIERWKEKFFHEEEMGDNLRKERGELQDELARLRALCGRAKSIYRLAFRLGEMAMGNAEASPKLDTEVDQLLAEFDAAAKGGEA